MEPSNRNAARASGGKTRSSARLLFRSSLPLASRAKSQLRLARLTRHHDLTGIPDAEECGRNSADYHLGQASKRSRVRAAPWVSHDVKHWLAAVGGNCRARRPEPASETVHSSQISTSEEKDRAPSLPTGSSSSRGRRRRICRLLRRPKHNLSGLTRLGICNRGRVERQHGGARRALSVVGRAARVWRRAIRRQEGPDLCCEFF